MPIRERAEVAPQDELAGRNPDDQSAISWIERDQSRRQIRILGHRFHSASYGRQPRPIQAAPAPCVSGVSRDMIHHERIPRRNILSAKSKVHSPKQPPCVGAPSQPAGLPRSRPGFQSRAAPAPSSQPPGPHLWFPTIQPMKTSLRGVIYDEQRLEASLVSRSKHPTPGVRFTERRGNLRAPGHPESGPRAVSTPSSEPVYESPGSRRLPRRCAPRNDALADGCGERWAGRLDVRGVPAPGATSTLRSTTLLCGGPHTSVSHHPTNGHVIARSARRRTAPYREPRLPLEAPHAQGAIHRTTRQSTSIRPSRIRPSSCEYARADPQVRRPRIS